MLIFSNFPSWIKPTVVSFLPIRWYALMYLVAFGVTILLFKYQIKKGLVCKIDSDTQSSMYLYVIIGLIVGARLFSTLLYDGTTYYWTHPWMIFWPFRNGVFVGLPGMSYHGGVVGAVVGGLLFCKKYKYKFFEVADPVIAGIPLGYTFGRLGNFINGELWGRCTGSSFGMIFPDAPRFSTMIHWVKQAADKAGLEYKLGEFVNLPRHPSQLYEGLFEGIVTFIILWFIIRPREQKQKKAGYGYITGWYFVLYGVFRFIIEYFREPDSQLGFIIALGKETEPTALFKSVLNISMGQILCFFMIIAGMCVIAYSKRRKK